ncbi:MAG: hypothetical protein A4E42_00247 [Methanoregulaceae archaeon PtaU1.Bin222]|nr:MAG: hypothetical protein A4E42_00247 [Methanoregulaceae archaeon PtaU1.Bin222]
MTAIRVLEHLDLVDHHGADQGKLLPGADEVIHALIGPDDNRGSYIPVANRSVLGQLDAGLPDQDPDFRDLPVPLFETLVLLDGKRHQGDQEKGMAPFFHVILESRHLPDERLSARGGRDDQEMLAMQETRIHRHLLCRHQRLDSCSINKVAGKWELCDLLGFLQGMCFEAVEECLGDPDLLRLNACEHLVHVPEIPEKLLKVPECLCSYLAHGGQFPPEFPPCAVETDLLPCGVPDAVLLIDGCDPVIHEADSAYLCMGEGNLEIMEKSLERLILLG